MSDRDKQEAHGTGHPEADQAHAEMRCPTGLAGPRAEFSGNGPTQLPVPEKG